ncbi:hypothetical protein AMECASPLE_024312 [Ameca splendens]|uniref:Uncharacterized protein n=1 Tax=Ameca splendens TaxID=208324 RepID=A0ABV0ZP76_9TELE
MMVVGTVQGLEHPTYQILNWIVGGVKSIIDPCSVHRVKLLSSPLADENTCSFYVLPLFFLCSYNPQLLSFLPHLSTSLLLFRQWGIFPNCSFTVYKMIRKFDRKMICICIYTCLSNYEYYNKTLL